MKNDKSYVVQKYTDFLKNKFPKNYEKYLFTESNNPDGAKFEAVCYSILKYRNIEVTPCDDLKSGGPDFLCLIGNVQFIAEATTIDISALENQTGMKHDQTNINSGFYEIYPSLYSKLTKKTKQVSGRNVPRIVFIGSFHNESLTLFREVLADEYLPAFFNDDLKPDKLLQNISAFALVGTGFTSYSLMGFLNPSPIFHFDEKLIPNMNFRKITKRGIKEKTFEGEWVNSVGLNTNTSFQYNFEDL